MSGWSVRLLREDERADWEPLWHGYQRFYQVEIPADVTELTWSRFHDEDEPMHVLGAFEPGTDRLVGIVHYLFHRSCWTAGAYCYLQDLFTLESMRGRGIGRALIEAVYERARAAGANRVWWLTQESNTAGRLLYDKLADRPGFIQYRKLLRTLS